MVWSFYSQDQQLPEAAQYTARVMLVHCALLDLRRHHACYSGSPKVQDLHQELGNVFCTVLELWEELKALEAKHLEEEAQLFKRKTRTVTFTKDEVCLPTSENSSNRQRRLQQMYC